MRPTTYSVRTWMAIAAFGIYLPGLAAADTILAPVPEEQPPATTRTASVNAGSSLGLNAALFERGRIRSSGMIGWGQAFGNNYAVIGAGVGYFVLPRLEVALDLETWQGDSPTITKVTPGVRYVFPNLGTLFPYGGIFYRRVFYSKDIPDTDSIGGRLGVYTPLGGRAFAGGGIAVERQLNCDQAIYDHCTTTYPEITIGVMF